MSEASFGFEEFADVTGPKMIPDRSTYAPAEYMQNPHRDPSLPLRERCEDGTTKPFVLYRATAGGEAEIQVKIGMIPLEHRQFVSLDGTILDQLAFKQKLTQWRAGYFRLAETAPPELGLLPVPKASRLLSLGVSKRDSSKLVPIGHERQADNKEVDDDPIVDASVLGEGWRAAPKDDDKTPQRPANDHLDVVGAVEPDAREAIINPSHTPVENTALLEEIEKLKKINEQQGAALEAANHKAKPKRRAKNIEAPCGKMLGGFLKGHIKACDDPACKEARA